MARGKCQWAVKGRRTGWESGRSNCCLIVFAAGFLVVPCVTLRSYLLDKANMLRSIPFIIALALAGMACNGAGTPTGTIPATESAAIAPSPATEVAATAPSPATEVAATAPPPATEVAATAPPPATGVVATAPPPATGAATAAPEPTTASRSPAAIKPAFPGLPTLTLPMMLVDVPEHDLYLFVLQDGLVLAVNRDGPYDDPRTVHDQRERTLAHGEEGLLAIALDPNFAQTGYVYAYYSFRPSAEKRAGRIARFNTTGQGDTFAFDDESELAILDIPQPAANHNGGSLLFGPDGMLYLGLGDGGWGGDPLGSGQDISTLLGTVIRIDVSEASADEPYIIPPDNPMVGREGARPEIWAYGLRNPWRMSFDSETGLLWAGDVGQNHAEEIDVILPGRNYGWNITEGTSCFPPGEDCDMTGITLPVWEYGRPSGCSIIGGYVYRGAAIPLLHGWYIYADYCTGRVWGIHAETAAAGEPVEEVLLTDDGPQWILSLAEDSAGEIYLLIRRDDGDSIYRLVAR